MHDGIGANRFYKSMTACEPKLGHGSHNPLAVLKRKAFLPWPTQVVTQDYIFQLQRVCGLLEAACAIAKMRPTNLTRRQRREHARRFRALADLVSNYGQAVVIGEASQRQPTNCSTETADEILKS
jgi:hypothetical protein